MMPITKALLQPSSSKPVCCDLGIVYGKPCLHNGVGGDLEVMEPITAILPVTPIREVRKGFSRTSYLLSLFQLFSSFRMRQEPTCPPLGLNPV